MKKFLSLAVSTTITLSMGAVAFGQHYNQTNLVSNTPGARVTDPTLVNPWGLSSAVADEWWVSDAATGLSTLYNGDGSKHTLVVTIPPSNPNDKQTPTGSPTGNISNESLTDYLLAPGQPAKFIFSTADGTIAAWNPNVAIGKNGKAPSAHAVTVARTHDGSVYTGLTSAAIDGQRFLYVANFSKGRVDVYDSAFQRVKLRANDGERSSFDDDDDSYSNGNRPFVDNQLPRDYVPFNVQAIGNDIVVAFVLHQPGQRGETDGPGLGYIDIFSSKGKLLRRLEHGSWLNAPWGVALAPLNFGRFSHDLLVGQFAGGGTSESSGLIAAYDLVTGKFDGLVQDANGQPLAINGIWALSVGNISPSNYDATAQPTGTAEIYFTAGPNRSSGGLFGYLTPVATELIEGSAQ